MALARLVLKNLERRASSSVLSAHHVGDRFLSNSAPKQRWVSEVMRRFSTEASQETVSTEKSTGQEIAVPDEGVSKKSKLVPKRQRRRGLWKGNRRNFVPALDDFFSSALGDALVQASENLNRLLENLTPSRLMGRMKEDDKCFKLRYEVPGLTKEDLKITIEDGVLTIKGEHKEEEEEGSEDEHWSSSSYGYYHTSLLLPEDAKADELKAELKDGVLIITIPRTEKQKKDVKEVKIL